MNFMKWIANMNWANWFTNALITVSVFAVIIVVAFVVAGFVQRGMNRTSASMSKKHKGLQINPYLEMLPGKYGRIDRFTSEIAIAPDADLSKAEKEDPRRA